MSVNMQTSFLVNSQQKIFYDLSVARLLYSVSLFPTQERVLKETLAPP